MVVSDDGQVGIIGHAGDGFFLYLSTDYGETFELSQSDAFWPVFNPQNQDGSYYFTNDDGSPAEMFIAPNGDGGHFNVLFSDDNKKIVYMTAFGLNSEENAELGYYLPAFFQPKIVYFDILNEAFKFVDLQVTGVDPNDDQPMIPYDLDEDGQVDSWDDEGYVEFAMCWPSHYFIGDYQDGSFSESCFKITQNKEEGIMAAIFMDGRYLMEAYYENPEYEGWEETAQIAVSISEDDGVHWTDPAYLNANAGDENFHDELEGMLPCYIYPADEIEYVDAAHYRIPIMFYDDFSYGSYAGNQQGQNTGGRIMYAEILIETTVASDENTLNPPVVTLKQNYPNPFGFSGNGRGTTTIGYQVKSGCDVELSVYNVKGQLIRTLINEFKPAGDHTVLWDGCDSTSRPVASGIYYYRLKTEEDNETRKMVFFR